MEPYSFLSALPALLGLAGFVLYQLLGANRAGDEISRRILDKLRKSVPEAAVDRRLTPKQVVRLLQQQTRARELVGEHDFRLLKQALTQQFVINILVYVLTVGFCAWSVHLFVQQRSAGHSDVQKSSGDESPNVISNGPGPVNVTIQDQTQSPQSPRGDQTKQTEVKK